jgi:peptidoglycan/xylan/chitin deacetylase (PgdA/CDA1 family)
MKYKKAFDKALFSFSFDDGREDNYLVARNILKKYNLPATFNIATAYIEGLMEKGVPSLSLPMNKQEVIALYNDGTFEIAGHGDFHQNDINDINSGLLKLKRWLGDDYGHDGIGFASPGTDFNLKDRMELRNCGVNYIRLSFRYQKHILFKILCRKISRIVKSSHLYIMAYKDTLMNSIDDDIVYAIPILNCVTFHQLKGIINYAIDHNEGLVFMLHSVKNVGEDGYSDNWTMDASIFDELCYYLSLAQSKGELKVVTTLNMTKLMNHKYF